jgi:hypothetical protein
VIEGTGAFNIAYGRWHISDDVFAEKKIFGGQMGKIGPRRSFRFFSAKVDFHVFNTLYRSAMYLTYLETSIPLVS